VHEARAVWFPAPRRVEVRAEPVGAPGRDEILVETLASAISHGTEMLVYRGEVPPDTALDLPTLAGSFAFPIKYGYAAVGRVIDVGDAVRTAAPGDVLFALHPHQDRFLLRAAHDAPGPYWRLPDDLPPERGVFAANVETALNVLLDAPVRLGEHVVVIGQGVVGVLIALLARRNGAGRVVVVDPIARRREVALALGADAALAPSAGLREDVARALESRGDGPRDGLADVAYEASGNPAALQAALDCVTDEGTVVVCSWYGTKRTTLDLGGRFHRGRVRLQSTQVGRINPALAPRWDHGRRLSVVSRLLAELPLERLISHRIPLSRAAEAYRLVDERPDETLQVVLTYR
jgi:2-desacetyl-2-hydroxyethyl bacteriochlorophyllide A dehydrogenase